MKPPAADLRVSEFPNVSVRLPVDIYNLLQKRAAEEERSLGGLARRILTQELRPKEAGKRCPR